LINVIVPEHVPALETEENFRERTGRAQIKEASPMDGETTLAGHPTVVFRVRIPASQPLPRISL
jgi:hypothetical protein